MNFRRGRHREEPEINLIPLIDLLLVVLIFLFVTMTFTPNAQLKINLPEAQGERPPNEPKVIYVAVDGAGRYSINGAGAPFGDPTAFARELKGAAKDAKEPVIAISADAAATHQSVVNIMESARIAGYTQISFTTQAKQK